MAHRLRLAAVWIFLLGVLSLARPTLGRLAAGVMVAASGEAIRWWAAGHLRKTTSLITSGPYRFVRNPLYLGRLLIFCGLVLAAPLPARLDVLVAAGGLAVFFGYYLPRKERVEPARLAARHGEAYERYRRAVPSLLPRLTPYAGGSRDRWSSERMLRNREHWMVAGLTLAFALLAFRI